MGGEGGRAGAGEERTNERQFAIVGIVEEQSYDRQVAGFVKTPLLPFGARKNK